MSVRMDADHKCFGCQKLIADHEEHIHVPFDDFLAREGMDGFGLDDLLTFAFCKDCIGPAHGGWQPESHEIDRGCDVDPITDWEGGP